MTTIDNDTDFRQALDALSLERQRAVGALFVEHVLDLSSDPRVAQALAAARNPELSEEALNLARRGAKAAALEAHTRCGSDGEWTDQAGYFVARAAEGCLDPEGRSQGKGPAWKAAMSARMARTCLAADSDVDSHDSESRAQYQILIRYLDA
jgi:hypothetical protein